MSSRDQINRSWHRRAYQQIPAGQRAAERWARAQAWSQTTGRPLPPQMRERPDHVSNAVPMAEDQRQLSYLTGQIANRDMARYGSSPLTARQHRRITHKRNHLAAVRRRHKASS
jgi:hypothetical protein